MAVTVDAMLRAQFFLLRFLKLLPLHQKVILSVELFGTS
jgi:hypothetical protein